ncbi:MAG: RNA-guided endonuclease InsQ/TnpB family protein, partial [Gammaproteobacteria bacterium]
MQRRKVTLQLYPHAAQSARLEAWTRMHGELYNAALEERIDAWRKAGQSISYYE